MSNDTTDTERCPIHYAMDIFGDKWTLLIIRDMMLRELCRYGEFMASLEDISTNVLANRLKQLQDRGLLEKFRDPQDGKSFIYLLTEKGLQLMPVLFSIIRWGLDHDEATAVPETVLPALVGGHKQLLDSRRDSLAARRAELQLRV